MKITSIIFFLFSCINCLKIYKSEQKCQPIHLGSLGVARWAHGASAPHSYSTSNRRKNCPTMPDMLILSIDK